MKILHGKIITCDRDNHIYRYLVEDKGKILHVGDALPSPPATASSIIELGHKAMVPGFGDAHLHFSNYALFAATFFDIREAKNVEQIRQQIARFVSDHPRMKKVIIAFGASRHSVEEKRLVTRPELDSVCPRVPLMVICYDGHSAICNSPMMDVFPEKVQKSRGFDKERGYLFNEAYYSGVDHASSLVSPVTLIKSSIAAYDILAEKGIGLIDIVEGVGFPRDIDVTLASLIAKARARKNNFQTRVFFQTLDVDKVLKRRLPRIGGCFAAALDGCFGACDAALHEPYTDDPANKGILFHRENEVMTFVKRANRAGLQVAMHAIGDAAVSRAVEAIGAALQDFPRQDHRHTIIHACLIPQEDLQKIAELGIALTMQPSVLILPLEPVPYLEKILGDRLKTSSPFRKIVDLGIPLSGGSDAPVAAPDPIEGIYGACNHPYDSTQSLSIQEALKMFTFEVARSTFDERQRGSLEVGKIADFAILNRDPLAMDPKDLRQLKVEELYLSGEKYQPGMSIGSMFWHGMGGKKIVI